MNILISLFFSNPAVVQANPNRNHHVRQNQEDNESYGDLRQEQDEPSYCQDRYQQESFHVRPHSPFPRHSINGTSILLLKSVDIRVPHNGQLKAKLRQFRPCAWNCRRTDGVSPCSRAQYVFHCGHHLSMRGLSQLTGIGRWPHSSYDGAKAHRVATCNH